MHEIGNAEEEVKVGSLIKTVPCIEMINIFQTLWSVKQKEQTNFKGWFIYAIFNDSFY